jgi:hypothetical protein
MAGRQLAKAGYRLVALINEIWLPANGHASMELLKPSICIILPAEVFSSVE